MVDELELLKKDWQKQDSNLPKLSKEDIYPMLLKKSSSIVKWILFISIAEFAVWMLLTFGINLSNSKTSDIQATLGGSLEYTFTLIHLGALLFFIAWFYKSYKKIESTDSPKELMLNILNTRKTVKYYIWFNIAFLFIVTFMAFIFIEYTNPDILHIESLLVAVLMLLIFLGIAIGILLLIYRLIYGRLLKKLKANYNELKKLEI